MIKVFRHIIFFAIFTVLFTTPSFSGTLYGLHMDLTFNGDPKTREIAIKNAKAINVQISRNSFLWHRIERNKGIKDWSIPDSVVDELLETGIEPLFCIYGSPSWANGVSSTIEGYYYYVPTENHLFLKWLDQYKVFVAETIKRYKNKVTKWELWNEQNQHFTWKPEPDVERYLLWYNEIYKVIKSIDPKAEVALGGLTGLCCAGPKDYNGNNFLQELYNRNVYPDIISIHPYSGKYQSPDTHSEWENNFDDIELIYSTMVANGQGGKKIWVTEWGWPTDTISEGRQAIYVDKSLKMISSQYPYVSVATYFIDYDRPPKYFHGLFTDNFKIKEAGKKFKEFIENMKIISVPMNLKIISKLER